jgi:hypothetical protein
VVLGGYVDHQAQAGIARISLAQVTIARAPSSVVQIALDSLHHAPDDFRRHARKVEVPI